jgi:hypothetical protein
MGNTLEIRGGLLARNTAINLGGYVIPLLVGLATIPYVVRGLGSAGFGILSIAWVLLGYLSFFDLGLGRDLDGYDSRCDYRYGHEYGEHRQGSPIPRRLIVFA